MAASAIETLVENHREFLSFLERRVGDRATAEDILQDAFVRSIDRVEALGDEESVRTWFYRVLRNAVIDHHRRGGTSAKALEALARELEGAAEEPELADAICGCVRRLADTLKPEYAEAIRRVEVEGMQVKAWAAEAGITPNNAAVRLHRAREALRRQVLASCGSCAIHGCVDCTCSHPEPC